jgi:predicted Fe-Mo cluster-binding NifX family protein
MTKIAIPLTDSTLSEHFGHCEQFAVYEMSEDKRTIANVTMLTPPPHEPGVFPAWLHGLGVTLIITGGMGRRALDLFAENGIKVASGVPGTAPDLAIKAFRDDALNNDEPACNHEHGHEHHCG